MSDMTRSQSCDILTEDARDDRAQSNSHLPCSVSVVSIFQ